MTIIMAQKLPDIIDFFTLLTPSTTKVDNSEKIPVSDNTNLETNNNTTAGAFTITVTPNESSTLGTLFGARPDQQVYESTFDTPIHTNKEKPTNQSLFHQRPEDFMLLYDDLPDEETMDATAAKDSIKNLLLPSEQKLDRIEKYVKDNNVPKVLLSQELTENENMFTRNGESYLLKDDHLAEVYEIIASLDDINTLAKTLKKRPSLLENLIVIFKKNKHEVLKMMDQALICF